MFSFKKFTEDSGEFGGKRVQVNAPFHLPSSDPQYVMGVYVKGAGVDAKVKLLRYIDKNDPDKKFKEPDTDAKNMQSKSYWEWKYRPASNDESK